MTMAKVVSKKAPEIRVRSRQQPWFFFIFERGWTKTLLIALPPPNLMNRV